MSVSALFSVFCFLAKVNELNILCILPLVLLIKYLSNICIQVTSYTSVDGDHITLGTRQYELALCFRCFVSF